MATPSLARSVTALLTVAIGLMMLVNIGTFIMIQRTNAVHQSVARAQDVRMITREIRTLAVEAETGQRGFLLTGRTEYLAPYEDALAGLPPRLRDLMALTEGDPELSPRIARLQQLTEIRTSLIGRIIDLSRMGQYREAIGLVRGGQGSSAMVEMRGEIDAIEVLQEERIATLTRRSQQDSSVTLIVNAVSGLLILVLAAIGYWLIRRYVRDVRSANVELDAVNAGLEGTIHSRTAALRRANEEVQRFAYIVSHDLRAPLVNIMGYTAELEQAGRALGHQIDHVRTEAPQLVEAEADLAVREDIPEAIGFIRASTEKMDRLINAILKLSREGRRALTAEPLDMTALVNGIARSVHHQVLDLGAEIVVNDLPPLESDRLSVEQVFGNLIDNAVKYLDADRPGHIEVSGEILPAGSRVYRVKDNGRGISERDHERIFELFRRAGRQDKPGEGLGLAFVRNAVRRLGGDITVTSEPGKGSTFVVTLPTRMPLNEVGDSA